MKIRVKSITYAMKAKSILEEYGINAAVVKDMRLNRGCIYSVSFSDQYEQTVRRLLRENGVPLPVSEQREDRQ